MLFLEIDVAAPRRENARLRAEIDVARTSQQRVVELEKEVTKSFFKARSKFHIRLRTLKARPKRHEESITVTVGTCQFGPKFGRRLFRWAVICNFA